MSELTFYYFDFDGGRGEPVRIALHAAGLEFEDKRLSFQEFGESRNSLRFSSVPILKIGAVEITQSNAISRYAGKLAGLYPADDMQALYCDEVLGACEDINHYIVRTFGLKGEELEAARKELAEGWLSIFLTGLGELLVRGGGQYFAAEQLTIADLKVFVQVKAIQSGNLDHIPADLVQRKAPGLVEHFKRVEADPKVAAYYASRSAVST